MTRKYFLYIGTALFVMGALPVSAASLPNRTAEEDTLYKEAILEDSTLDKVTKRLGKAAVDRTKSKAEPAEALLVVSNLHWRNGARAEAMKAIDRALDIDATGPVMLQKARLLDAAGKTDAAQDWYQKALPLVDADRQGKTRLRLAIMKAGEPGAVPGDLRGLVNFAKNRDQNFQNRAAVTLSLLGFEGEALDLYKVTGPKGTLAFRQYIRLGEWAIRADKAGLAQQYARRALDNATLARDRLYGLAILVESHRLDDSLDQVIRFFEGQKNPLPEATQTWVELLREMGRPGEALALLKKREGAGLSARMRQQLIRLYQEVGREEEMIEEYRALIAKEPDKVNWPAALSEYYLELGQSKEAAVLWQEFVKANADSVFSLLKGAELMSKRGFETLAKTSLEDHMKAHGTSASVLFFLFELNKEQGRAPAAEKILARLEAFLSPAAAERVDLAGAYERLKQPEKALAVWEGLAENGGGLGSAEKMRIARLYGGLGRKKAALNIWRALWHEVKNPARRGFVESRMMMLAEETGELDHMILELEEKLFSGKAGHDTSALLIRIYTQKLDKLSAVEIIDEYFGKAGTVEALSEQAQLFQSLDDYAGLEKINRKLVEADPENSAEYLRSIILSLIRQRGEGSTEKIFKILADLRRLDEDAVGGEFEAGVMVLAGLPDAAIATYRQGMAKDMSNSDNYLLISDLLKKRGRMDEALALLQYAMEEAEEDDLFVVAVDGIINMVGRSPVEALNKQFRPVLIWVRRLILERLAEGTDRVYLYTLFGEVNDELGNRKGSFAALENKLSLSEVTRAVTLRELIVKSKPKIFDKEYNQRYLAYGRRLVSLNEELPPEVYTDLGEAFLEQKDPVGALKAFNMAIDITGRKDILAQTADLFEQAGYEDQALYQYRKTLVSDNKNIEVLLKIGLLQELKGQKDKANGFFGKALEIILLQLPTIVKKNDRVTREYQRFYKKLLQGYLTSWPKDIQKAEANFERIEHMLEGEIRRVATQKGAKIAGHSRLDHMAGFVRRVAFATGNPGLADKMDGKLLVLFGDDDIFTKFLIRIRLDWGLYGSARKLVRQMDKGTELQALLPMEQDRKDLLSFARALERAKETKSFDRVKNIALLGGRVTEIMVLAREMAKSGAFMDTLNWGKTYLDSRNYQNLCEHLAAIVRRNPEALMALNYLASEFLFQLEKGLGEQVFSEGELAEMLAGYDPGKMTPLQTGY